MLYRPFGKTGDTVSALGMGGMRFAERDDLKKASRMLVHALERGITYFDTAAGYPKSEETYGHATADMKKTGIPFYVATKTFGDTEQAIRADLERSLSRMKLDCIDYYHVWCIITFDELERRRREGCFETMLKLKEEGKVRHIVLSTHMPGTDISRALREHEDVFEGVLLGFNGANFPYRWEGIREAAALNKGVVTMNPLGGGVIPENPGRFGYLKRDPEESVVESAIRFNMSHPEITVTLVGMRNERDVDEAVAAADRFEPLTAQELEGIRRNAGEGIEGLCTSCNYCKECPEGIPVMKFMEALNEMALHPDAGYKGPVGRLKFHWGIEDIEVLDRCIRCGQCERSCTQQLPIMERFAQWKALWEEKQKAEAGS